MNISKLFIVRNMTEYTLKTPQQLGAILRGRRREKAITQQAMGEAVDIRQAAVSQIENDPSNTRFARIFQILSGLDLELVVRPRRPVDSKTDW